MQEIGRFPLVTFPDLKDSRPSRIQSLYERYEEDLEKLNSK